MKHQRDLSESLSSVRPVSRSLLVMQIEEADLLSLYHRNGQRPRIHQPILSPGPMRKRAAHRHGDRSALDSSLPSLKLAIPLEF